MADMGLDSYRFSICRARIYPENMEEINPKGIQLYTENKSLRRV